MSTCRAFGTLPSRVAPVLQRLLRFVAQRRDVVGHGARLGERLDLACQLRRRRGRDETIYTFARNKLIHSEAPGRRDPAAALAEVERLTPDFQRLVARVVRKG